MRESGFHNYPSMDRVVFGKSAASALRDEAKRLEAKRVFIIASRTLNTKTDEIEKIRQALGSIHAVTIDGIAQHTSRKEAAHVASQAKEAKADLLVAVGGGSAVDLAKIVIMAMEHDIQDEAGFDAFALTPSMTLSPFRRPSVRQIAIPSTLNGGEFNAAALVTDQRTKLKQIFIHPHMMPVSIILDPTLTRHTPTELWMGSGTRAMDHGIEALCSPAGTPLVDEVVLAGIRNLRQGMLRTLNDPADLEARRLSQYGTWMSAFGLQARVPMGASHGIGHVLGGTFNVPHYFCTPVIMPSLLRYNAPVTGEAQKRLALALGHANRSAADAFAQFTRSLGLPSRLSEVGIGEDKFAQISKIAINHRFVQTNPRRFENEEDIVELLKMAA